MRWLDFVPRHNSNGWCLTYASVHGLFDSHIARPNYFFTRKMNKTRVNCVCFLFFSRCRLKKVNWNYESSWFYFVERKVVLLLGKVSCVRNRTDFSCVQSNIWRWIEKCEILWRFPHSDGLIYWLVIFAWCRTLCILSIVRWILWTNNELRFVSHRWNRISRFLFAVNFIVSIGSVRIYVLRWSFGVRLCRVAVILRSTPKHVKKSAFFIKWIVSGGDYTWFFFSMSCRLCCLLPADQMTAGRVETMNMNGNHECVSVSFTLPTIHCLYTTEWMVEAKRKFIQTKALRRKVEIANWKIKNEWTKKESVNRPKKTTPYLLHPQKRHNWIFFFGIVELVVAHRMDCVAFAGEKMFDRRAYYVDILVD